MELSELKTKIIESFSGSAKDLEEILHMVDTDKSIFPFNEYEHLICNLIERGGLNYEQYIDIRTEYISANPNLWNGSTAYFAFGHFVGEPIVVDDSAQYTSRARFDVVSPVKLVMKFVKVILRMLVGYFVMYSSDPIFEIENMPMKESKV